MDFQEIWNTVNVRLVNVINPDKLCVNLFKGFDFARGQFSIFSIGKWRRRYNSAALPRSLWMVSSIKLQFSRPTFTNSKAIQ